MVGGVDESLSLTGLGPFHGVRQPEYRRELRR